MNNNSEEIIKTCPKKISNDIKTIEYISSLWYSLKNKQNEKIVIDVKNTIWIDSNMCAALGIILEKVKQKNEVVIRGASPRLVKVLTNNRFLSKVEVKNSCNYKSPYIRYEKFWIKQKEKYEIYLLEQIPRFINDKLNQEEVKEFIQILVEMLVNINMHTDSYMATTSGVYYPESKQMYFTICNHGITFSKNIEEKNQYVFKTDKEAIAWAVKKNSSTRKENGVGGLGFYVTREFVKKFKGALWVISGSGYWKEEKGEIEMYDMNNVFPGTVITIKLNLEEVKSENSNIQLLNQKILSIEELIGGVI